MNTQQIRNAVQVIETAKTKAEAAETAARQVAAGIEQQSANAVRLLRRIVENAERVILASNQADGHQVRRMLDEMDELKGAVVNFGLLTDFKVVAHKLGVLQEDLNATSEALKQITPQD